MKGYVKEMVEDGRCWRRCGCKCPLGKDFLEQLYTWNEINYLHPNLAWKICEACTDNNYKPPAEDWRKYL